MKRIAIVAALSLFTSLEIKAEETFIAVLNEPQMDGPVSAKILFVKKGDIWHSVEKEWNRSGKFDIPDIKAWNWTVAFDGRNLGQLKLFDPNPNEVYTNSWAFVRDKFFNIETGQKIPKVQNRSMQFGGWLKTPENRPLVLVSKPNFSDPEHWKSIPEEREFKSQLYVPLKLAIGRFNAYHCPDGPETSEEVLFDFQKKDMVFYKAYGSKNGSKIVAVGIDNNKHECDGPLPPEWADNWFLIDGKNIEFIGREMTLIDAGDYDGDGKSELLFWHNGYNRNGYILISNSFKQRSQFIWGYH